MPTITMELKSKSKKRYYLHSKLKKEGVDYDAHQNTIWVPYGTTENDLSDTIKKLRDNHGYSVTFKIQ